MREIIADIVDKNPFWYSRIIRKRADVIEWLDYKFPNIDDLKTKIYLALNPDKTSVCPYGNFYKLKSINGGFRFCKKGCQCEQESIIENSTKTKLEKGIIQNPGIKHKKQVRKHYLSTLSEDERKREISKKRKNSCIINYGQEYPTRSDIIKNKTKRTNISRYGTENPSQSEQIKRKIRLTNNMRYDADWYVQSDQFLQLRKEQQSKLPGGHNTRTHNPDSFDVLSNKIAFEKALKQSGSVGKCSEDLNVSDVTIYHYIKEHDIPWHRPRRSTLEYIIQDHLSNLGVEFETNSRIDGVEYDFVIPSARLAIETCGLYWHSDKVRPNKYYHLEKLNHAKNNNLRLLTIFEDELMQRRGQVLSRITNIVGLSTRGYGARKLTISSVDKKLANKFLDQYHIQGQTRLSQTFVGAWHSDELVAVCGFRKTSSNQRWELTRFSTDGRSHPGVLSKLLKHADVPLYSFADRRWSEGEGFIASGFILDSISQPDYSYIKGMNRYHKFNMRKAALAKKLEVDPSLYTEKEMADALGYLRIWDCGKIKLIWN